ncbi:MAG TPA: hypothetical protein ACFYD3_00820 [Candidatus Hypogeohydataceae bacterium YC41]
MQDTNILAPLSVADLPPKTGGFLKVLGPGAILLGLSIRGRGTDSLAHHGG